MCGFDGLLDFALVKGNKKFLDISWQLSSKNVVLE
jgi:hypothetical protein